MHRKQILSTLLAAALLTACAAAEPLTVAGERSGTAYYPEGTDAATATYTYSYAYPLMDEENDVGAMINENYNYLIEDALTFTVPINGGMLESVGKPCFTAIRSEITCNNDDWFSVLMTTESDQGEPVPPILSCHVYARKGAVAGTVISLPRLLGILDDEETDEWMKDRQTNKANELVWGLLWEEINRRAAAGSLHLVDGLTYEDFQYIFYPEEDFYLDAAGNPVFFVQAGCVADAAEGIIYLPVTLEYLKDEL